MPRLSLALLVLVAAQFSCADDAPSAPESEAVSRVERAEARFRETRGREWPPSDPRLDGIQVALSSGADEAALARLATLLAAEPAHPHALYLRGYLHHRAKLYAKARPDFEKVLESGPAFKLADGVFVFYGWCCYYLGDLDAAEASFEAARRLGVDPADSSYGLGLVATERGDLALAEASFRESFRLASTALANKGAQAKRSDRVDVAKAEVRLATVLLSRAELEPAKRAALLEEARVNLERALVEVPGSDEAWFAASRLHRMLGNDEKAGEALERHLAIKQRESGGDASR
jgi:tetratricopeptide (TPR) repeat protein